MESLGLTYSILYTTVKYVPHFLKPAHYSSFIIGPSEDIAGALSCQQLLTIKKNKPCQRGRVLHL